MVNPKLRTDFSVLYLETGSNVTLEECIPRKKKNMKSPEMLPQRKDPITNQDINMLGNEKDQSLPPQLSKFFPRYKSLKIGRR